MKPRILVVEDDLPLGSMLERGLHLAGYEVTRAGDGIEGEQRWREGGHAVIILDVVLGGGDGIELCRLIRGAGDDTPVILLTARDDDARRAAGMAAGASAYVTKPFVYAELMALIGHLAQRPRDSGSRLHAPSR